jgi:hypothetical protein
MKFPIRTLNRLSYTDSPMSQPPPQSQDPQQPQQPAGPDPAMGYPSTYAPDYSPTYSPGYSPGYSPQYGFWPYYLTPPEALLGPARRASLMLFLLGGLLLLAMTCMGASVIGETDEALAKGIEDMRQVSPEAAAIYTPQILRTAQGAMAVMIGLLGLTAIILGVVVRSGSRASSITALVLVVLPTLCVALLTLCTLVGGPAMFLAVVAFMLIPFILSAMTISFLIGAIRAAGQVDAARRQMYAIHQHQQMQYQAYAQQPPQA